MGFLDTILVYSDEQALLDKLGVKPWPNDLPNWKPHTLEPIQVGNGRVVITITGAPCHFFDAEIFGSEGGYTKVSTGSGSLCEYWPMFRAICEGMLVVKDFKPIPRTPSAGKEGEG